MNVAVGGVGVNVAVGFIDFDVSIHGTQLVDLAYSSNSQRAVRRAQVFDFRPMRNVDGVLDRNFDAFVLRVAGHDGDTVGLGLHVNRDALQVRLAHLARFHRV